MMKHATRIKHEENGKLFLFQFSSEMSHEDIENEQSIPVQHSVVAYTFKLS